MIPVDINEQVITHENARQAASDNGLIASLSNIKRLGRAVPKQQCYAAQDRVPGRGRKGP